jgi:uncharacterized protein YcbK (DUF882 family)
MEMVKKYKRSDKVQLSKNFRLDEFKCKCGKCDPILVDDALVTWLQKIRDHFGKSVNVNSGYRCKAHNASPKVGGNPGSHHVKGMAADIRVQGILPEEVAKYAESIGIKRIGLYDNFVHIGSDTKKRFWLGHEGKEVHTFGGSTNTVFVELPVLKKGANGDEVKAMQALLNLHIEKKIDTYGSFGGDTLSAVKEFQRKVNVDDDGSCGKATWSSLLGVN